MESFKARFGGKSLRALGKKVLHRAPGEDREQHGNPPISAGSPSSSDILLPRTGKNYADLRQNTTRTSVDPLRSSDLTSRTSGYHLDTEQDPVKEPTSASLQRSSNPAQAQVQRPHSQGPPFHSDGNLSHGTPAFLARPLDLQWIDIEMMGYWLQKCDLEHGDKCRKPFGLDPADLGHPKLLIDVERKCLVVAKPNHCYACLSYVWGNAATLRTESANLDILIEEQSLESCRDEIPKTIRDTMGLCAQLGIPYLWVDALCIVQDDSVLKHDDIHAMAGIYANAYVTFIASNGWDANHGLRGIQGVTEPRHLSSAWKPGFVEELEPYQSIWYSRGWTFQEMVFSPRKIMFDFQMAVYECNEKSWHESSLSKVSTALTVSSFVPSINPWKSRLHFTPWPDVEQYVRAAHECALRKFTYAEDSLHAIASLLSVMNSSFEGGFISGLPVMFFDEALLWQPAEPMQRRQASAIVHNPPTWSWTGWEGRMMLASWLRSWSHLSLLKPSDSSPSPDSKDRMIISAVEWFYGNTLEERVPINVSGHKYKDYVDKPDLPPPPGWSYGDGQYCYRGDIRTRSAYPLPIASTQSPCVVTARYLFCRTRRGYFWCMRQSGRVLSMGSNGYTVIQASNGTMIGTVNVILGSDYQWPANGRKCELVVISAGILPPNEVFKLDSGEVFKSAAIEAYNVLWVEWIDGIAYRKGLGRISKKEFDSSATEDIDLVLG